MKFVLYIWLISFWGAVGPHCAGTRSRSSSAHLVMVADWIWTYYMFLIVGEIGAPGGKPRRHEENMGTPHSQENWTQEPCCEAPVLTPMPQNAPKIMNHWVIIIWDEHIFWHFYFSTCPSHFNFSLHILYETVHLDVGHAVSALWLMVMLCQLACVSEITRTVPNCI